MTTKPTALEFSRPVCVSEAVGQGPGVSVEATLDECKALAADLNLERLESLSASFSFEPWRSNGVKVKGQLKAVYVQLCVVSLEPLTVAVKEAFALRYLPAGAEDDFGAEREITVELEVEDPPEILEGDELDCGVLAAEYLALLIDPYPRKEGVSFDHGLDSDVAGSDEDDGALKAAFSELARLKNRLK